MASYRSDYQPFAVDNGDGEKKTTTNEGSRIEEWFMNLIPYQDFREYPPRYIHLFGSVLLFFVTCSFIALFGYLYASNVTKLYLAPGHSGGDATQTCTQILTANSGEYLATKGGVWQGQDGFEFAEASYSLTITNWKVSNEEYSTLMKILYNYLKFVGEAGKDEDLGKILLKWFSFTALPETKNLANRVTLTGDPSVVINRQNIYATISSIAGECYMPSQIAKFDRTNSILSYSFSIAEYQAIPACLAAGNPAFLGYDESSSGNNFELNLDVRTLITALAVNLGILDFNLLVEIKALREILFFQNQNYTLSQYFDPKFRGMSPIVCIQGIVCGIRISPTAAAMPFFHHAGMDDSLPIPCNCSTLTIEELSNPYFKCNLFQFLTGFLYFPYENSTSFLDFILSAPIAELHAISYYPSFVGSAFGLSSSYYQSMFNTPGMREQLYSFCKMGNQNCTMVTFSLLDINKPDWSVSANYYQLQTGACRDTITPTRKDWSKLVDEPFTSLVQDYVQCQDAAVLVFFTQLGSALGTMDLLILLSIILTFTFMFFYLGLTGEKIPEGYSKDDRDSVLKAFAISLLLARDRIIAKKKNAQTKKKGRGDLESPPLHGEGIEMVKRANTVSEDEREDQENVFLEKLVCSLQEDSVLHGNIAKLMEVVEGYDKRKRFFVDKEIPDPRKVVAEN